MITFVRTGAIAPGKAAARPRLRAEDRRLLEATTTTARSTILRPVARQPEPDQLRRPLQGPRGVRLGPPRKSSGATTKLILELLASSAAPTCSIRRQSIHDEHLEAAVGDRRIGTRGRHGHRRSSAAVARAPGSSGRRRRARTPDRPSSARARGAEAHVVGRLVVGLDAVRMRIGERIRRRLGDDDADLAADVGRHPHVAGDVVGLDPNAIAGAGSARAPARCRGPARSPARAGRRRCARRSSSSRVTRPFSTHSVARLVSDRS